jgi:hypothetical protein
MGATTGPYASPGPTSGPYAGDSTAGPTDLAGLLRAIEQAAAAHMPAPGPDADRAVWQAWMRDLVDSYDQRRRLWEHVREAASRELAGQGPVQELLQIASTYTAAYFQGNEERTREGLDEDTPGDPA